MMCDKVETGPNRGTMSQPTNLSDYTLAASRWLTENNTPFELESVDHKENRLIFGSRVSHITFTIACPREGESWGVCSEQESMLGQLHNVMEYLDSSADITMENILSRITRSLSKAPSTHSKDNDDEDDDDDDDDFEDAEHYEEDEDEEDEENDFEEDEENGFDYYEEGDPDAEEEEEEEKEDDSMNMFFAGAASQATPSTIQRLCSDMRALAKTGDKYGFTASPEGNNLFKWNVKLLDIPGDSTLGKDLQRYAHATKQEAVIQMEMQFPPDYPYSPPFLRVLKPRFKFLTGHVTVGGSICMQMLTKSGWLPTNDIEGILVQVRSEILSDPKASLDQHKWDLPYTESEARQAFNRMVQRYGWK